MKVTHKFSIVGISALVIASAFVLVAATGGGRIFIGDNEDDNGIATPNITADEATAIALNAVSGDVISVELENEDGYLVYGIHIQNAEGTWDVKVDAGTGDLLKTEIDDGSEGSEGFEN